MRAGARQRARPQGGALVYSIIQISPKLDIKQLRRDFWISPLFIVVSLVANLVCHPGGSFCLGGCITSATTTTTRSVDSASGRDRGSYCVL